MAFIDKVIKKAKSLKKRIVLPEGHDPRVIKAAAELTEKNIAEVVVLASNDELEESAQKAEVENIEFEVLDYLNSENLSKFAEKYCEIRKKKNLSFDDALEEMKDRVFYGAMMTRLAISDGLVAGSIASTPHMLRASFRVIGTEEGIRSGSSCFIMDLKHPAPAGDELLLYADCGVNPDPDAEQLVDIALATAASYRSVVGETPKLAFLSFSTHGSTKHKSLIKIKKAAEILDAKKDSENLEIISDSEELQADAAIVPSVADKKCPDSPLEGRANVLIFPDLNSGNIAYKLTERLAGAGAYGPILQGLAKPLNDLSRGCSADDILKVAAITACQAK